MPTALEVATEISHENKAGHPVVQQLQRQLANAFVLYANYKHYHWHTFGPHFSDLHMLFDTMAAEVLATADPLAERIRMLGPDIDAIQLRQMQEAADVRSASRWHTVRAMIEEADANLMGVIRDMRTGAREADKAGDPGTVDLFSRTVQVHEKHEWFLRETLRTRDGLVV